MFFNLFKRFKMSISSFCYTPRLIVFVEAIVANFKAKPFKENKLIKSLPPSVHLCTFCWNQLTELLALLSVEFACSSLLTTP
jgi:hypothetical protein